MSADFLLEPVVTRLFAGDNRLSVDTSFRKMKNYMKVEGFRKFLFSKPLSKTFWNPKFDCKNRISKR